MSIRQANLAAAVIVVALGVFFCVSSLPIYAIKIGAGPGAGVFPFWVGLLLAVSGLAYVRISLRLTAPGRFISDNRKQQAALWQDVLLLIAYVALMPFLGFALATFLFLVLHLRVVGESRWLFSVVFAAIATALCTYAFRIFLYISLPRGFVGF